MRQIGFSNSFLVALIVYLLNILTNNLYSQIVDKEDLVIEAHIIDMMKYYSKEEYNMAIDELKFLVKRKPSISSFHYYGAKIYESMGDLKKAITFAHKANDLEKNNFSYQSLLAELYNRDRQYDNAIELLDEMIVHPESSEEEFYDLARLYFIKGDFNDALDVYERAYQRFGYNEFFSKQKQIIHFINKDFEQGRRRNEALVRK